MKNIKFLIKKINTETIKKNKAFEKATKPERRVMVAKDVLEQLKKRQLVAMAGRYVGLQFMPTYSSLNPNLDIKENYDKVQECHVCALGACIMATTRFTNQLNFEDVGRTSDEMAITKVSNVLTDIFTPEQLHIIEIAFEGHQSGERFAVNVLGELLLNREQEKKCRDFYESYHNDDKRLIAIMENIIKNKGEFIL